jgi:PAS domain S-box-containing protein
VTEPSPYARLQSRIISLLARDLPPDDLFTAVAEAIIDVIPIDRFSLGTSSLNRWHVYEDGKTDFEDSTPRGTLKAGFSASSWVLNNGKSIHRPNLTEYRFEFDKEMVAEGYHSDAIIPLTLGDQTIGTANFTCKERDVLSASHLNQIDALGDLLGICAGRIQDRLDIDAIRAITQAVQSSRDLDEILRMILAHIQSQGYDRVRVYLLEEELDVLRGAVQAGAKFSGDFSDIVYRLDEDPYSQSTFDSDGAKIYVAGTDVHRAWVEETGQKQRVRDSANEWAEIALRGRDGLIVGKIAIDNATSGRRLRQSHLGQLTIYTAQAAIAIQQARMYQDLEREVERRAARLQESQRRYRNLFENMQDGAAYHQIIVDDEGNPIDYVFLEANKAFEKLTGLDRSGIIGRRVTDVIPDLTESEFDWIGTYGRVALTGAPRSFEQHAEPLGKWFDVSAYSPEKGYFVAIFQDVTERREALAELRVSEEASRQRSARQAALLRINVAVQNMIRPDDLETVLITCLKELNGLGVNAQTMAVHQMIDPDEKKVLTYRIDKDGLLAPPELRQATAITQEWQTKQITLAPVTQFSEEFRRKFQGIPIQSCLDVPYSRGVISVHSSEPESFLESDVEELTQVAEILSIGLSRVSDLESLETRTEALIESEAKWRSLVENATDVITNVDRDGQILFMNHPIPGRTIEETIGTRLHDHANPEDHGTIDACLKLVFESKASHEVETRGLGAHRDEKWLLSRVSPIIRDDSVTSCHIISRDITALKQTESELLRLERFRALGEMSAGVSHNLNNILTGIMGPAELLTMKTADQEILSEAGLIFRSATRARDLVRRLDRSIKGSPEVAVAVDVNAVIAEALEISRPRWKDEPESMGRHIDLCTDLKATAAVSGTVSELTDIVVNLVLNAVDALPNGGSIHVETEDARDRVILTVRDDGLGMDEETREKVFDPFFTTKSEVGTGLGLSTVRGSIRKWDGAIQLESAPGEGSVFRIELLVREDAENAPPGSDSAVDTPVRVRVISVEDEDIVREVIQRMVSLNHDIEAFGSGRQALETFAAGRYDVALIDLGMPEIPGDTLAEEFKKIDPQIVTVLVSGWSLPDDDERLRYFDLQLRKPIESLGEINRVLTEAREIRKQSLAKPR